MSLNLIPLDQITEANLQGLLDNRVPEGRDLEYKRDAIGRDDASKKEFLKDVSAMANTAGGDLIIGIGEADGVAATLNGITSSAADDEVRRLDAILQDGLEPRLVGTHIKAVPIGSGGYVLVVRIQASWNAPHRVIYQRNNRFFGRSSAGTYELGVEQLRAAFLGGVELERRLNDFRFERIAKYKGDVGIKIARPGFLILHISSINSPVRAIDFNYMRDPQFGVRPMPMTGYNTDTNFDGLLLSSPAADQNVGYIAATQVFRSGTIESIRGRMIFTNPDRGDLPLVSYGDSVRDFIEFIPRHCRALNGAGAPPPYAVMLSLVDMAGSFMLDNSRLMFNARPLDRADLLFSAVIIDDLSFPVGWQRVLRETLDTWWNAFGWNRCVHLFNDAGEWTGYPHEW